MNNGKTDTCAKYPITPDTAANCLGVRLRSARKKLELTQLTMGERIHKSRVVIANYECGKASPEPDVAIQLAKILGEDLAEYLLLSNLQRVCSSKKNIDMHLLQVVNQLFRKREKIAAAQKPLAKLKNYLTLADFPSAFTPITIVVGDKREEIPQNSGDLFAFSASTSDDRWIMSLGLPPDTEKISDKVIMTAEHDEKWKKKHFATKNILCIGSPASNLFTRKFNNCFLFRFAISRETYKKYVQTLNDMSKLQTQAALLEFRERCSADLKQKMRLFKSPGLVDFGYEHLRLGIDLSYGTDFAVVSLGRNPYADKDAPFFSILAAGVHHPGTAHAVRFLSDPTNFEKHPFGGILEVEVPSKKADPANISWHNKIEESVADWHTVGKDRLEYKPEDLLKKLEECKKNFCKGAIVTDLELDINEIDEHIKLVKRLIGVKSDSVDSAEKSSSTD